MLIRLIPELGKYAMDSSMAMLLFLIVLVMVVAKYILEKKKLLKKYETFWIYPFLSVLLLIGLALIQDALIDLYIVFDLVICVYSGMFDYRQYKKSRNRMESCKLYIPVLPDNTVIFDTLIMDGEIKVFGFVFYNTIHKKYETYGIISDETLAKVRNNEPDLYKKIMSNEPVNAQNYPLSCVWESNIPKEHDELLQYIIEECVCLYSDQLIEFGEYMDKETNIIFQLYGKRNDAVSITLNEYFLN